jgi:hypothetical protein
VQYEKIAYEDFELSPALVLIESFVQILPGQAGKT